MFGFLRKRESAPKKETERLPKFSPNMSPEEAALRAKRLEEELGPEKVAELKKQEKPE